MARNVPLCWAKEIDAWCRWLAVNCSAATVKTRRDSVRRAARALGGVSPWSVSSDLLAEWFAEAGAAWSREYRRSLLASLRGFYAWAVETGRVSISPLDGLPRVRPGVGCPRPIGDAELEAVLRSCEERTALILRLAAEAGLRRSEIACLHRRDLSCGGDWWTLVVHGKGEKVRRVPLPASLGVTLELRWRELGGGFLFPGQKFGHLSAHYVGHLASQVLPEGWGLHTLRHRFASVAYQACGDLLTVQALLGHSSVATTQRYVALMGSRFGRVVEAVEVGACSLASES